jgi:Uma2 family endonuclease
MTLSWEPLVAVEHLGRHPQADRNGASIVGRTVDLRPAHGGHGRTTARVLRALVLWAAERDAGEVLGADAGFLVRKSPETVLAPDVSFLRKGRPIAADSFIEGAPDVAVEVLARNGTADDVEGRVRDYLEAGAAQVWTIDPEQRSVTVHARDTKPVTLAPGDVLEGGPTLPGFQLAVRKLFSE